MVVASGPWRIAAWLPPLAKAGPSIARVGRAEHGATLYWPAFPAVHLSQGDSRPMLHTEGRPRISDEPPSAATAPPCCLGAARFRRRSKDRSARSCWFPFLA